MSRTSFIVVVASLGTFQFGYHLAELNMLQEAITCPTFISRSSAHTNSNGSLSTCIIMTLFQWGLTQSMFTLGGFLGAISAGQAVARYGQIQAMKSLNIILVVGALLQALSPNLITLLCGRWISGLGAGSATVVCTNFVTAMAPPEKRGQYAAFTQIMINLGMFVAQLLGYFLGHGSWWRCSFAVSSGIALLTFVGLMPLEKDAPAWARAPGTPQKGLGLEPDTQGHCNTENDKQDEDTPLLGKAGAALPVSIWAVITQPEHRNATIAVTGAMMAQQLTGVNAIVMYSVTLLQSCIPSAAALATVMLSAVHVLVCLLGSSFSDRVGRKPSLLISTTGMTISAILVALGLRFQNPALSLVALILSICSFDVGLGPVPFTIAHELVQPEAVGAVSSIAMSASWVSAFCIAQFFPVLNTALADGGVYWIFAGIGGVFMAFVAWWIPESKGKKSSMDFAFV